MSKRPGKKKYATEDEKGKRKQLRVKRRVTIPVDLWPRWKEVANKINVPEWNSRSILLALLDSYQADTESISSGPSRSPTRAHSTPWKKGSKETRLIDQSVVPPDSSGTNTAYITSDTISAMSADDLDVDNREVQKTHDHQKVEDKLEDRIDSRPIDHSDAEQVEVRYEDDMDTMKGYIDGKIAVKKEDNSGAKGKGNDEIDDSRNGEDKSTDCDIMEGSKGKTKGSDDNEMDGREDGETKGEEMELRGDDKIEDIEGEDKKIDDGKMGSQGDSKSEGGDEAPSIVSGNSDETVLYSIAQQSEAEIEQSLMNATFHVEVQAPDPKEQNNHTMSCTLIEDATDKTWQEGETTVLYSESDSGSDTDEEAVHFVKCPVGMTGDDVMELPMMPVDGEIGVQEEPAATMATDTPQAKPTGTRKSGATITDASEVVSKPASLAYNHKLLSLARKVAKNGRCRIYTCRKKLKTKMSTIGSAVKVKWVCTAGHNNGDWESQDRLASRGVYVGDFLLACNTLLSGNNFAKLALFHKFMMIPFITSTFFSHVQSHYCIPEIERFFNRTMDEARENIDGPVILSGDARNDSPGHSAQFGTYTTMNTITNDIIAMCTKDKRETGRSSYALEKAGFEECLEILEKAGVEIGEIVTDAHPQITALLKKMKKIIHQHDIWHSAKNRSKKLNKIAQKAANKELRAWIKDVINHFWYCSEYVSKMTDATDKTKAEVMRQKWRGVLHHIVGRHSWATGSCDHAADIEETKPYLKEGSPAHQALSDFVLDRNLLRSFDYYVRFRHTGQLEVFHSLILLYAGKRFAFSPPVYKARVRLAAIDYQKHKGRNFKYTKAGKATFRRTYNKKSATFSVVPMKEEKEYDYIPEMQTNIINKKLSDDEPMHRAVKRSAKDPRHMGLLASADPPSKAELIKRHKSRLGKALPQDKIVDE